ncbi:hypothetical protein PYJP_09430 [Pyrofollis japonicus]|uniref:hypothetical protein n=1 Tax=Pyrofollis japonicus TaxID=3060460 RepID=UPI00295AF3BD|nr:hypothetical protein [Pyrofollis japonicus]BEP17591.1 hypothetical protein PYJP_09430 [Pyrofollis japonicus]
MLEARIEKSKSRRGKHAVRDIVLLVSAEGDVKEARPRIAHPVKPVYSKGEAYRVYLDVPEGWYMVQVHLVRNLRGHVKGYIEVYSPAGELLLRANYEKLKLRYSKGNPQYSWIIQRVADYLKLPVKNINLEPAFLAKRSNDSRR